MNTGNAGSRGLRGAGGVAPIGGGGAGPIGGGGAGPIGGLGAVLDTPKGGGGAGPIGGGAHSQQILQHIATKFNELSTLFNELAGTRIGGLVPDTGPVNPADFKPQISFSEEHQQGYELCWIAVAVSVKHHFNPASTMRQCELVQAVLGMTGPCCANGGGGVRSECDKPGRLEEALGHASVHHLAAATLTTQNPRGPGGAMSFEEIKEQIDDKMPVCIFIEWSEGGIGHFSLISGYQDSGGTQYLYVNDPLFGSGLQPYNRVVSNYNLDGGKWQYTYQLRA